MLARGATIGSVVASFCGSCSAGRCAQAQWLDALSLLPTLLLRRRVLEHFLRTFNGARLHGSQWRVVGAEGFVGKQHRPVPQAELERVDPETGEYTFERAKGYPKAPDWRHMPAENAGGLAALSDSSPRTLNRHRFELRRLELIASKQPPYTAPDAKKQRGPDGRWAYAQHWLRVPPTPEMLARWRGRPAELPPTPAPRRRRPYSVAQAPRVHELEQLAARAERVA